MSVLEGNKKIFFIIVITSFSLVISGCKDKGCKEKKEKKTCGVKVVAIEQIKYKKIPVMMQPQEKVIKVSRASSGYVQKKQEPMEEVMEEVIEEETPEDLEEIVEEDYYDGGDDYGTDYGTDYEEEVSGSHIIRTLQRIGD